MTCYCGNREHETGAHVNFVCCWMLYRTIALSVPTASRDPSEENFTQQTTLDELVMSSKGNIIA